MKKGIQALMQRILGFENYLFWFCRIKVATFRWESKSKDGDFIEFLRLIKPNHNIIDIGANIGIMSTMLAKKVTKGKVVSIEPIPENFKALQRIIKHYRFPNVISRQLALGEASGELAMTMPVMNGVRMQGLSHVQHDTIEGYEDAGVVEFHVPVKRLDQMPEVMDMTIHAIKIDVENYEQFVLRGAKELLIRDMPSIYCELWPNENRDKVFELLTEIGYKTYVFENNGLVEYIDGKHSQQNFFFLPVGRTFPK